MIFYINSKIYTTFAAAFYLKTGAEKIDRIDGTDSNEWMPNVAYYFPSS